MVRDVLGNEDWLYVVGSANDMDAKPLSCEPEPQANSRLSYQILNQ